MLGAGPRPSPPPCAPTSLGPFSMLVFTSFTKLTSCIRSMTGWQVRFELGDVSDAPPAWAVAITRRPNGVVEVEAGAHHHPGTSWPATPSSAPTAGPASATCVVSMGAADFLRLYRSEGPSAQPLCDAGVARCPAVEQWKVGEA